MAASVNKVIILGNLGKDPEIRSFQNGGRIASMTVATSETWKDKATGEKKERTEWHRVSIVNDALVGVVEKWLRKGAKVYIEGQLETRKWTDKDGNDKFATEIVLRPFHGELTIIDSGKKPDEKPLPNNDFYGAVPDREPLAGRSDLDDEIPF